MKSTSKLALVAGTVLTLGLAGTFVSANPEGRGAGSGSPDGSPPCVGGGPGYGMGPGYHMGSGYGMGSGNHMGRGSGMGPGYGRGPGNGMGPGYGRGAGYGMGPGGMTFGSIEAVSERMEALKSALGITAEQQTAWQGFADSAKVQVENHKAWFDMMHESKSVLTAPDWFAQRDAAMKQHEADREAATAALKSLYGVLTAEQRATLDQQLVAGGQRYARRGR